MHSTHFQAHFVVRIFTLIQESTAALYLFLKSGLHQTSPYSLIHISVHISNDHRTKSNAHSNIVRIEFEWTNFHCHELRRLIHNMIMGHIYAHFSSMSYGVNHFWHLNSFKANSLTFNEHNMLSSKVHQTSVEKSSGFWKRPWKYKIKGHSRETQIQVKLHVNERLKYKYASKIPFLAKFPLECTYYHKYAGIYGKSHDTQQFRGSPYVH